MFRCLHDFAKLVGAWQHHHLIPSKRQRNRAGQLSLGQMLLIILLPHISADKDFKHVRLYGLTQEYRDAWAHSPVVDDL